MKRTHTGAGRLVTHRLERLDGERAGGLEMGCFHVMVYMVLGFNDTLRVTHWLGSSRGHTPKKIIASISQPVKGGRGKSVTVSEQLCN